jgi:hypothetical protein
MAIRIMENLSSPEPSAACWLYPIAREEASGQAYLQSSPTSLEPACIRPDSFDAHLLVIAAFGLFEAIQAWVTHERSE